MSHESSGTQKWWERPNMNNFSRKWNKKFKFGIYTNFNMRNWMVLSVFQKIHKLVSSGISQRSPGTQKDSKGPNINIFSRYWSKSWNLALRLISTWGIQRSCPHCFKIRPHLWDHKGPQAPKKGQKGQICAIQWCRQHFEHFQICLYSWCHRDPQGPKNVQKAKY